MKVRQYGVELINDNDESMIVHRDIDGEYIAFDVDGGSWGCKASDIPAFIAALEQFIGEPTEHVNQLSIEPAIGVVYGAGDEIQANARLIVHAPQMYRLLASIASVGGASISSVGGTAWTAEARRLVGLIDG